MKIVIIRESGSGSMIVTLPQDVLDETKMHKGDKVLVEANHGMIRIRKAEMAVQP